MAVNFTKAKDLIEVIATRLAAEATAADEAALSSALTEFADEVSTSTMDDSEFFLDGNDADTIDATAIADTWCKILDSASDYLQAKSQRIIKEEIITIDDHLSNINDHLDTNGPEGNLAEKISDMRNYQLRMRELADGTGIRIRNARSIGEIFYYRNWIGNRKILSADPTDNNPLTAEELSQLANLIWTYRQRVDQIDAFFNDFDGPDGTGSSGTGV